MFNNYLQRVVDGSSLEQAEMEAAMNLIMEGRTTHSQLAGFLVGLRMKGESIAEITGAARVMREKAISIEAGEQLLVDTCGTGGDGKGTFNISTTVALVLAGAGLTVAKHGNRSVSSKSGSADVLEALGIKVDLEPAKVEQSVKEIGMGFLYAPAFHKAMKHAVKPRKELGLRTIFNILGPLTNPARADYQVLGVYHPELVNPLAEVLKNLGVRAAMVVHGAGGIDEFSISGDNKVAYLHDGIIEHLQLTPEEVGLQSFELEQLQGGLPEENRDIILEVLKGKPGPRREVVVFNSAAALIVTGMADDWQQGIKIAGDVIDQGLALKKLNQLKEFSNSFGEAS